MKQFRFVKPFEAPLTILNLLSSNNSEMHESELCFLCGLIRDHRPKKIVEVGVAAGGTTAVILNCIKELELNCFVYSVDVSEQYYRDPSKKTGYLIEEIKGKLSFDNVHTLLLGKVLPEWLEEIGDGIDFLILDTMHKLPGELLDYLAAFPYLSSKAIVVLHNTRFHYISGDARGIATSVIFHTVTADKYLNCENVFPNIAAFQLNPDTAYYMTDVFASLMTTWSYMPPPEHLKAYETQIKKNYTPECLQLYQQSVSEAYAFTQRHTEISSYLHAMAPSLFASFQTILLYGAGQYGKAFLRISHTWGLKISGFVVSDGHSKEDSINGIPIFYYSQIPFNVDRTLIIQTANSNEIMKCLSQSHFHWLKLPDEFWFNLTQTL